MLNLQTTSDCSAVSDKVKALLDSFPFFVIKALENLTFTTILNETRKRNAHFQRKRTNVSRFQMAGLTSKFPSSTDLVFTKTKQHEMLSIEMQNRSTKACRRSIN